MEMHLYLINSIKKPFLNHILDQDLDGSMLDLWNPLQGLETNLVIFGRIKIETPHTYCFRDSQVNFR